MVRLDDGHWRCSVCGNLSRRAYEKAPKANCGKKVPRRQLVVGTCVSRLLALFGITKRRVTWLQRKLGLIPPAKTCGCGKREEVLNEVGDRLYTKLLKWWNR